MNKQKAYIYSRITPFSSESVLDYQIHKLVKFAQEQDLEIEYVSHSVGMNLLDEGYFFDELMSLIRKEVFDVLVIWSPLRITTSLDLYEEFEMFCMKHNVRILTYKK